MNKETKEIFEKLGGRNAVSFVFDVTYAAVMVWEKKGVPAKYVPTMSSLTGCDRSVIRPDLYGKEAYVDMGALERASVGLHLYQKKKRGRKINEPKKAELSASRDNDIYTMYTSGKTLQEIGDKYGFTRERARQILSKYGVSRLDGGQAMRSFACVAHRGKEQKEKTAKRLAKSWGCTKEQYDFLRGFNEDYRKTPLRAYTEQKRNAKVRGISWDFNLWSWWKAWDESGKWSCRGRGRDKYVMARIADLGGYNKGNVEIITMSQNAKDYYKYHLDEHKEIVRKAKKNKPCAVRRMPKK